MSPTLRTRKLRPLGVCLHAGLLLWHASTASGATYNYTDGQVNTAPITISENGSFNITGGTATQSGQVSLQSSTLHSMYKYGAGELNFTGIVTLGYLFVSAGDVNFSGVASNINYLSADGGNVTISGGFVDASAIYVGTYGTGSLTLQNGATLRGFGGGANGYLNLGYYTGSGTLNIGAASGQAAVAPGVLNVATIRSPEGLGTIVFNHTGSDYFLTSNGASNWQGTRINSVENIYHEAGNTTLVAMVNAGTTVVSGGELSVWQGITSSTLRIDSGARLNVNNSLNVTNLTIEGTLSPGAGVNDRTGAMSTSALQLGDEGTLEMDVRSLDYLENDSISTWGTVGLDGTLRINFLEDFRPEVGDTFRLFDLWGGLPTGEFDEIEFNIAGYEGVFEYEYYEESAGGISFGRDIANLRISQVPEPSAGALALLMAGSMWGSRRRRHAVR